MSGFVNGWLHISFGHFGSWARVRVLAKVGLVYKKQSK